jgi:hypothetical protein
MPQPVAGMQMRPPRVGSAATAAGPLRRCCRRRRRHLNRQVAFPPQACRFPPPPVWLLWGMR